DKTYSTREFLYLLGKHLINFQKKMRFKIDVFVTTAVKEHVPIYCPSIADSSIGIALTELLHKKNRKIKFDLIKDVQETAFLCAKFKSSSVIYICGVVPKNFIQQTEVTAPYIGYSVSGHKYAIQITQDAPHWGGLSGCTFKEAQSWGKIACDAKTVTVYADATIALPILATALAQEKIKRRFMPQFELSEDLKVS
ncbi:MAG: deoxyhypusine synthase family protein, partial [candidate division WOR-3 bacterium]|nr:deoxyhypusine synthase family protein [candidate division WOR-3 bacterium]